MIVIGTLWHMILIGWALMFLFLGLVIVSRNYFERIGRSRVTPAADNLRQEDRLRIAGNSCPSPRKRRVNQEDGISNVLIVRHRQTMEAGGPIRIFTLLRVCESFAVAPEDVASLAHHLRNREKN